MITLTLTPEELQFIVNAIADKPYVKVEHLIQNIRNQVDQQKKEG